MVQKAPRRADVPLRQYSDTTIDVPVAKDAEKTPRRQHEDCMTKFNEIQMEKKLHSAKLRTENKKQNVFDSESRSDSSFTVHEDTEVIHREVRGGTKINCYLKENQSEFSGEPVRILGNTSTEGFGEETLRTHTKGAALRVVQH